MVDSVLEVQNIKTTGITPQKDIVTTSGTGDVTVKGNVVVPDGGTIGSASDTDAITIDSSGNVGVGTTNPSALLHLRKDNAELYIDGGSSAYELTSTLRFTRAFIQTAIQNGSPNGDTRMVFSTQASGTLAERLRIDSSGALILAGSTAQKASGTTWTNPSDIRLKENITNYSKGINELIQIEVKQWEYNGKAGTVLGQIGLGVIADEIESVLPNTVDTYSAKLNEDDETETDIKKFDATEITWLLVNTCKEQQTIIESQQSQIEALTARIEALENTAG